MVEQATSLVLIGCGYLGGFIAQSPALNYPRVIAVVRSQQRVEFLRTKCRQITVADVFDQPMNYIEMAGGEGADAIFMIPPSAIDEPVLTIEKVVSDLVRNNCRRALLISSTGVYGRPDNEIVTAESVISPHDHRSERLAAIENTWLEGGERFRILRLAGIYGPERIIGKARLRDGKPVGGEADAWLNLIHVADAASLSLRCLARDDSRVELGADGNPSSRGEYYGFLAELFGYQPPQFTGDEGGVTTGKLTRNSVSKKCDPSSTHLRLNWAPQFKNYKMGIRGSMSTTEV